MFKKSLKNDNENQLNALTKENLDSAKNALASSDSNVLDLKKGGQNAFEPLSISFDSLEEQDAYRGATAVMPIPSAYKGIKLNDNIMQIPSMIPSKMVKKQTESKLDDIVLPKLQQSSEIMNDSCFVASKIVKSKVGAKVTPSVYKESTSFVVKTDVDAALNGLDTELSQYSNDIEYSVDKDNYIITGIIFMMNVAVNFAINIFKENSDKSTRIEFNRYDGDSIKYQEFYQNISKLLKKRFRNNDGNNIQTLSQLNASLDFNLTLDSLGLPMKPFLFTKKELNRLYTDIKNDEYTVESLNELTEACKQNTKVCSQIINESSLFNEILNKLKHKDIVCVRQTLLLLTELKDYKINNINIINKITKLLNHSSTLIRVYAVKTLHSLKNIDWTKSNINSKYITKLLQKCENDFKKRKFASPDFITKDMFNSIYLRLV